MAARLRKLDFAERFLNIATGAAASVATWGGVVESIVFCVCRCEGLGGIVDDDGDGFVACLKRLRCFVWRRLTNR